MRRRGEHGGRRSSQIDNGEEGRSVSETMEFEPAFIGNAWCRANTRAPRRDGNAWTKPRGVACGVWPLPRGKCHEQG